MSDVRIDVHPEHQHRSPVEIATEEARALGSLHVPAHASTPRGKSPRPVAARPRAEPPVIAHGPHPTHCEP